MAVPNQEDDALRRRKSLSAFLERITPRLSPMQELENIRRFCGFCYGKGCFDCDAKTKRKQQQLAAEYAAQFPNDPEPILTIPLTPETELQAMNAEGCPNDPPKGNLMQDVISRMSVEDAGKLASLLEVTREAGCVCRFEAMGECPVHGLVTD